MMRRLVTWAFQNLLIPLLRLTTRLGGEPAWQVWERLTTMAAGMLGRLARARWSVCERPLAGMMKIVDEADGLIGAEGEWTVSGPTQAVKRITHCPYAGQLSKIPGFCTLLGVSMGKAAFGAYAPGEEIAYAIPRALSKGDPYCEYVLAIDDGASNKPLCESENRSS